MYRVMKRRDRMMSKEDTEALLGRAKVGRLGLAAGDLPYVVPVNYVYLGNKLYFHSSLEGQKMDFLRRNPRVCFEADELLGFTSSEVPCSSAPIYRSVVIYGLADVVKDAKKKEDILRSLVEKYYGSRPPSFERASLESTCVVEISIENMTGKERSRSPIASSNR